MASKRTVICNFFHLLWLIAPYIHKTIWFNFKYFPFGQARKFPVIFMSKSTVKLGGKCTLKVKKTNFGMIKIGQDFDTNRPNLGVFLDIKGEIEFYGTCQLGHNCCIKVGEKGKLSFGDNFIATNGLIIYAYHKVNIGASCLIGWDSVLMDTSFHILKTTDGKRTKGYGSIRIGDKVWIQTEQSKKRVYTETLMMTKLHMNNDSAKVSVTVPVYNTAKYLDRCLSSLIEQTLQDIEIVLVDDGSTDGSDSICDSWAERDNRIKVIHQRNGGLWKARQTGLENATGEFIIVCDSDDWVDTSAYEKAYTKAKAEDADIVIFGYVAEYNDGSSKENIRKFNDLTDIELTRDEIMRSSYYNSWNKLIRRSLFTTHNIYYEPGINMGEDHLILQKLLSIRPLKLCTVPEALYHYRINSGGYTTDIKPEYIHQL